MRTNRCENILYVGGAGLEELLFRLLSHGSMPKFWVGYHSKVGILPAPILPRRVGAHVEKLAGHGVTSGLECRNECHLGMIASCE